MVLLLTNLFVLVIEFFALARVLCLLHSAILPVKVLYIHFQLIQRRCLHFKFEIVMSQAQGFQIEIK